MSITFPIKWVIPVQKIKKLKTEELLRKNLGCTVHGSWALHLRISVNEKLVLSLRKENIKVEAYIDLAISLYSSSPKKLLAKKGRNNLKFNNQTNSNLNFGSFYRLKDFAKKKIIITGKLSIRQRGDNKLVSEESDVPVNKPASTLSSLSLNELSSNLSAMFDNQLLSDVIVRCDTHAFSAHKFILRARCPVLAEVIQSQDSENGKLDINDLTPAVVKALLFYIYSGKIETLSVRLACDLLYAAKAYSLQALMISCVEFLKNSLSVDNVILIFAYSRMYDEVLKFYVLKFMSCHFSAIERTAEWQKLKIEQPDLTTEILSEIVKLLE